ncbi:MAG: DUF2851 family protein [Candidatus Omnitrophica bacterium]|nr:DUF2851 family protein [Candidatus Omnitrophota bacterium]
MKFKPDLLWLGEKWLESKIQRMQNLLKIALPDEALYREIMLSLGYPKNKVNFLELALITPYAEIKKLKEKTTIQQALLYRAGFIDEKEGLPENFDFSLRMDKSIWEYKGIRPANYPEKRIKGISPLLSESIEKGLVNFFLEKIKSQTKNKNVKSALKNIMNFKGIGIQRKEEMFFNIIMPFMIVFTENRDIKKFLKYMFENYPPLAQNKIIKSFNVQYPEIKLKNVKAYMGAIFFQSKIQHFPKDV